MTTPIYIRVSCSVKDVPQIRPILLLVNLEKDSLQDFHANIKSKFGLNKVLLPLANKAGS